MAVLKTLKTFLGSQLPAAAVGRYRRFRRRDFFSGDFPTWADARTASKGYDDAAVLQRVVAATREVVAGRVAWERDGVTFGAPEYNEPLLAVLLQIAAGEAGRLDLVDFGGALGSTWWQHRAALPAAQWRVVEQAHYVEAGREFADDRLQFHPTIDAALRRGPASTILFSGVLQYLESPAQTLAEAVSAGFRHIVIDRTSFAAAPRQRIVVQHPPAQPGCSYPCWLFEEQALFSPLARTYRLQGEWTALDDYPGAHFRGFHFVRHSP